jgi:hypothetical protein
MGAQQENGVKKTIRNVDVNGRIARIASIQKTFF